MDQEYEELKKKKLQLEINELDRPYRQRPTFWISAVSVVIALVGVLGQSYLSNIQSERAELEVAQSRVVIARLNNSIRELRSTEAGLLEFLSAVTNNEPIDLIDRNVDWPRVKEQIIGMSPGKRKQALLYALLYAWKDIPFTLGGRRADKGFDSPAFLAKVLSNVGVIFDEEPGVRLSELMISQLKKTNSPQPGDIVFYKGQVGNFDLLLLAMDNDKKPYVGIGTLQQIQPFGVRKLSGIRTSSFPLV